MAGMERWRATIEASDATWIRRGDLLVIGDGDAITEVVRAVAVDGSTVTIGRYRWWHRLAPWLRKKRYEAADAVKQALCGLRGHRLTVEDRDSFDGSLTQYCWCGTRYEDVGEREEP